MVISRHFQVESEHEQRNQTEPHLEVLTRDTETDKARLPKRVSFARSLFSVRGMKTYD